MRYARLSCSGTDHEIYLYPGERRSIGPEGPADIDLPIPIAAGLRIDVRFDGAHVHVSSPAGGLSTERGDACREAILEPEDTFTFGGFTFRFSLTDLEAAVTQMFEPVLVDMPEILHSAERGGPFETCQMCELPLLTHRTPYLVYKLKDRIEVRFEFALCMRCAGKLVSEYSTESRRRMEGYLKEDVLVRPAADDACRTCGKPVSSSGELNISGHCIGRRHIPGTMLILCFDCAEVIQSLASKATRDRYQDFMDSCFPGIPEGLDVFDPSTILF